ncbi:MAG: hypothetical protein A2X46_06135 [Lentisphaerae bacterium GWF2_57_35]|nr:MAG: hypothetical protein A2X46_06135 [Lentisphaerae bacterium GWF2_57_35]
MNASFSPKTILTSTATGRVIPYTLMDIRQNLVELGHCVWVQDNARLASLDEKIFSIVDGLVQVEPDAFVTVDQVGILPEVICLLDRPPLVVSWIYDDPRHFIKPNFLAVNSHLHLFCWDRAYLPYLQSQGLVHCHYQPFATNPQVHRPLSDEGYDYEVSFVGAVSPLRANVLRQLAEKGIAIDVFGDEAWTNLCHPLIRYRGVADNRRDCPRIYSRSKINLNMTSPQLLTALPVRVFDVLGCEGFLLTDRREDVDRLFTAGQDLAVYDDAEDLAAKVRYYLDRPEERDAIRRSGRTKVLQSHTFDRILPAMLKTVFSADVNVSCNAALSDETAAKYLWLVGTSYMKFGKYRQAYPRLLDALRLNSRSTETLMSMTLLAHVSGQAGSVQSCLKSLLELDSSLADWAVDVTAAREPSIEPAWWQRLYRLVFSELTVQADGTVLGWKPRQNEVV